MRSDDRLILDMLAAAKDIQDFTKGITHDDFWHSRIIQSAVLRELQVMGEAARMLSSETKDMYAEIPWEKIAGMRNRVIHEYFAIDLDITWDTISESIPEIIEQLEDIAPDDEER